MHVFICFHEFILSREFNAFRFFAPTNKESFSLKPHTRKLCVTREEKFEKLMGKLEAKCDSLSNALKLFFHVRLFREDFFLSFFSVKWASHLRSTKFSCILHTSSSSLSYRASKAKSNYFEYIFYAAFHSLRHLKTVRPWREFLFL